LHKELFAAEEVFDLGWGVLGEARDAGEFCVSRIDVDRFAAPFADEAHGRIHSDTSDAASSTTARMSSHVPARCHSFGARCTPPADDAGSCP